MVLGFFSVLHPIHIVVATLSKIVTRAITLERAIKKRKKTTKTKNYAKKITSDNFTRSNKEKSNISVAILEK